MLNRKKIYVLLGIIIIVSLFLKGIFLYLALLGLLTILYLNRCLYFTIKANKHFQNNNNETGYKLLEKAYRAGGLPFIIINGYIYSSLKFGFNTNAKEAIENLLDGKVDFKLTDSQRNMILTQKSLYLWCNNELNEGLKILEDLYASGYKTTTFYGNFGCLLYLSSNFDRAKSICLEAYEYGKTDKVTLDNLVAINIELSNWEEAEKYFLELMDLKPSFAEAYYHGAIIFLQKEDYVESQRLLDICQKYELSHISSITQFQINTIKEKTQAKIK